MLVYKEGKMRNLVGAYRIGWNLSKNGNDYFSGNDFFSVHYEVNKKTPNEILLHIESPEQKNDTKLNQAKQQLKAIIENMDTYPLKSEKIDSRDPTEYKSTIIFKFKVPQLPKISGTYTDPLTGSTIDNEIKYNIEFVDRLIGDKIDIAVIYFINTHSLGLSIAPF
jgi:hypothetical protein